MGYKIGVPSMKLNNAGNKSKHCGSFGGVAREALKERIGLDRDINPELSHLNVYTGYHSAAELMEYSEGHLRELKDASGRGIRKDAVVMCTTIFKPPAVYMNSLSIPEQQHFLGDCLAFFKPIVGEQNIKATAQHYDEQGGHMHIFWEPMTADGRLCAKEIHNIKFFSYINENLPAFLRERGWDIDDADCYDRAQRELEEQKEREKHYQKQKKSGRSSAVYKLEAEKEKQTLLAENDTLLAENKSLKDECVELRAEIGDLEHRLTTLHSIEERDREVSEVEHGIGYIKAEIYSFNEQIQALSNDMDFLSPAELKNEVKDLAWSWSRVFKNILDVVSSVVEKIKNIDIFEKIRNIPRSQRKADDLQSKMNSAYREANNINEAIAETKEQEEELD